MFQDTAGSKSHSVKSCISSGPAWMLMVLQYLTARPVVSIVTMNASQPQRRCSWIESLKRSSWAWPFHNTHVWPYVHIPFNIPNPSNCVQQQPLLKNRVLRYLLIDHQWIEQQHQRSQAKDSFAKTCQTLGYAARRLCLITGTLQICGTCFRAPPVSGKVDQLQGARTFTKVPNLLLRLPQILKIQPLSL